MTLFVSRWGDPNATKNAFLIHGLTSTSGTWTRFSQDLTTKSYLVTAPDHLGQGSSHRVTDYTLVRQHSGTGFTRPPPVVKDHTSDNAGSTASARWETLF
ncbi:hypothetical protein BS17DRAFT_790059 [Gyrodon lividus]|nr:hypothetical protein BS17DRAFT_790059 [Gyrodon lividus]